jgi:DNA-binding NarL/FixJ family response regulator
MQPALKYLPLINSFYARTWSHTYMFSINNVNRSLTPRENEVLERLIAGESNKGIANLLGITEATAKMHVKNILTKMRLKNRTQAAVWGIRNEGGQMRRASAA